MSVQTYNHQIFTTDNLAHSYSFIEEQEKVVKLDNKFLDTIIAINMTEENCTVSTSGNGKTTYFSLRLSEDVANLFKDEKRNMVILNNYYCLHRSVKYSTGTKFFGIFYDTQWKGQITCYHLRIDGTLAELMTEVLPISMLDNDANFINEESVDAKIDAIDTSKDWNQNDETAANYIENRTHYVISNEKSSEDFYAKAFSETDWVANNTIYGYQEIINDASKTLIPNCGTYLSIDYDGIEYIVEVKKFPSTWGKIVYVGNLFLLTQTEDYVADEANFFLDQIVDTKEPFLITFGTEVPM